MTSRIPLLLFTALLAGCAQIELPPVAYSATIKKVQRSEGQFHTISKGYGVQYELTLDIKPAGTPARLYIFDTYSPAVFGNEGDEISFLYAGDLPRSGRLWLDQLRGYRVVKRVDVNLN